MIKEIDILGENRFETFTKTHHCSRAVIIKDHQILLVHALADDVYMIPGGGQEGKESNEECCIREVQEETGLIVSVDKHYLTINEYYEEWRFIDSYFICHPVGTGAMHLTSLETKVHLVKEWIDIDKAIELFSRHNDYHDYEEKRGIYYREWLALTNLPK